MGLFVTATANFKVGGLISGIFNRKESPMPDMVGTVFTLSLILNRLVKAHFHGGGCRVSKSIKKGECQNTSIFNSLLTHVATNPLAKARHITNTN